jgi:NhaA family Na+:H+ antiporter
VDDLGAIVIIAAFFAGPLHPVPLAGAVLLLVAFGVLVNRFQRSGWLPWLAVPVALAAWWCMYRSGVHATVAGVVLGLLVPVHGPGPAGPAERLEHRLRPWSSGVAVPIFALLSAGVSVSLPSLRAVAADAAAVAVVPALLLGKFVGVVGGSWLTTRFTGARLADDLAWRDVGAVGVLAGIGFTVSLLIAELAFTGDPAQQELVKTAVLIGSVLAGLLAVVVLRLRTAGTRVAYGGTGGRRSTSR